MLYHCRVPSTQNRWPIFLTWSHVIEVTSRLKMFRSPVVLRLNNVPCKKKTSCIWCGEPTLPMSRFTLFLCRCRYAVQGTPPTTSAMSEVVHNTDVLLSRHPLQHLCKKLQKSPSFYLDIHWLLYMNVASFFKWWYVGISLNMCGKICIY